MLYLRLTGAVFVVVVEVVEVVVAVDLVKDCVEESKVVRLCVVGDIVNNEKEVDSVSSFVIAAVLAVVMASGEMVVEVISDAELVAAFVAMVVGAIVVVAEASIIMFSP